MLLSDIDTDLLDTKHAFIFNYDLMFLLTTLTSL